MAAACESHDVVRSAPPTIGLANYPGGSLLSQPVNFRFFFVSSLFFNKPKRYISVLLGGRGHRPRQEAGMFSPFFLLKQPADLATLRSPYDTGGVPRVVKSPARRALHCACSRPPMHILYCSLGTRSSLTHSTPPSLVFPPLPSAPPVPL